MPRVRYDVVDYVYVAGFTANEDNSAGKIRLRETQRRMYGIWCGILKDEGYDVNIYTLKLKSLDEDLAKRNIDHAEWGHAIYALLTEMIKITESKLNVVLVRVEE